MYDKKLSFSYVCLVFRLPFKYWASIQMVVRILDYHLNKGVQVCYSDVSIIQIPSVAARSKRIVKVELTE